MIGLVASAMATLMPAGHGLPGVEDTGVRPFLRTMRREADPLFWRGLLLGALVFHATPVLTLGVPLPARLLPARWRQRHAERLVYSRLYPVRQAVLLLRLSAGLCWGRDPVVRARFALPPYAPDPGTFRTSPGPA